MSTVGDDFIGGSVADFYYPVLSLSTGLMPFLIPWVDLAQTSSTRETRLRRIAAFYDHVAEHARAMTD